MPDPIREFASMLVRSGYAVWVIGSQVNGTATPDSDWDLLVFGDEVVLAKLHAMEPVPGCDLMVVHNGAAFIKPWEPGQAGGSLANWEWHELNSAEATYKGTKWPDDWGSTKRAIKFHS